VGYLHPAGVDRDARDATLEVDAPAIAMRRLAHHAYA
jgi:hypothetical protein